LCWATTTCATGTELPTSITSTLPLHNPGSTKRFYSFDWGGAYFVALDSELYHDDRGAGPEGQKAFLERDLAATRKRWKFTFLHRSLFSSSRHVPMS
jgi:hypothetical protein